MGALKLYLSSLTIEQLIGRLAGIVAVVSVFVEITPIKINPITHILRWIGVQINKDLSDRIDKIEKTIDELEWADVVECRVRILRFADDIRRGERHSQEMFNQALSDIDTYDRYCETHPKFKNNKALAARQKILEIYSKCIDEDDFL